MKRFFLIGISFSAMVLIILDTKTALTGCEEGIALCLKSVIPSLFPFILLSRILTMQLTGMTAPFLAPLIRILRIPAGSETIPLIGLLGGYPAGAQSVYIRFKQGALSRQDAGRMLGFCSNCGPAFIFGIGYSLFPSPLQCWMVWLLHIASAFITAFLLPGGSSRSKVCRHAATESSKDVLLASVKAMAGICGWVIVFRIILAYLSRLVNSFLPDSMTLPFFGLLEMTNGCLQLASLSDDRLIFLLFEAFVSFGGLCVAMQTVSVCSDLGTGFYFPGKILQLQISVALSILYLGYPPIYAIALLAGALCESWILRKKSEKSSRNPSLNPV